LFEGSDSCLVIKGNKGALGALGAALNLAVYDMDCKQDSYQISLEHCMMRNFAKLVLELADN